MSPYRTPPRCEHSFDEIYVGPVFRAAWVCSRCDYEPPILMQWLLNLSRWL